MPTHKLRAGIRRPQAPARKRRIAEMLKHSRPIYDQPPAREPEIRHLPIPQPATPTPSSPQWW